MAEIIRLAARDDKEKVISFLPEGLMDKKEVEEMIENFLLIEDEWGNLCGTIGLVAVKPFGLLRYFIISPQVTETGLLKLLEQMLLIVKKQQFDSIYLATNHIQSQTFFSLLGFQVIEAEAIPQPLQALEHIQQLKLVDNSTFMKFSFK